MHIAIIILAIVSIGLTYYKNSEKEKYAKCVKEHNETLTHCFLEPLTVNSCLETNIKRICKWVFKS